MDGPKETGAAGQMPPLPALHATKGQRSGAAARSLLARAAGRNAPSRRHVSVETILLARGAVDATRVGEARRAARTLWTPVADILLARGDIDEADLLSASSEAHGLGIFAPATTCPDPSVATCLSHADALALDAVPLERVGNRIIVATSRPDRAEEIRAALTLQAGQREILTLAARDRITEAQIALYGDALARLAEGQAPQRHSCRGWHPAWARRVAMIVAATLGLFAYAFPVTAMATLFGLVMLIFLGNTALKAAAFAATLRHERTTREMWQDGRTEPATPLRLPVVSILVPLYRERDITSALIARLQRLNYPRERLDVLLAVEHGDETTRAALAAVTLPAWIRVVTVPPGHPRTKPRALNFALNFARGEIIGVYDAEDRPDPDQIDRVVRRFASAPPDTACLQGRLDYYNARHNLMARLFTIEYATWFRVLLPGVQRLGLFVPLGGTTLFLRRDILIEVGGWDAHNVTEDAELGLRLARHGYRTEIVETTTYEEANAAVLPWLRQRARWQKGYLMTWAMAMRQPRALWRDLGPLRFISMQVQILFAVAGFVVAPLLWSLVIKPFGAAHPLDAVVGPMGYGILATAFVAALCLSLAIAFHATKALHLRSLRPWLLLSEFYFLLGTLSAWRAMTEMLLRPFWWAKTDHGRFGGLVQAPAAGTADGRVRDAPTAPLP